MIFQARIVVFLLAVATVASAEETKKAVEPIAAPENKIADLQPTPAPSPASNGTTVAPVTLPTVPPSNSTTTTQAPTPSTTTAKPPTPTPTTKPTTTSTTTTTTVKPSPTTPSTTPQPTPTTPKPTPPKKENWIVSGVNGTVCITANMVISINVPFKSIENKTVASTFKVDNVENATATGTCTAADNAETLVLTWSNITATFKFALNVSDHTYSLSSVSIDIPVNNVTFPNNTMTNVTSLQLLYTGKLFSVPQNNSYTCTNVAPLSLSGATFPLTNNTINGKLTVAHVHVQAFGTEHTGKYRAPLDCASTETPDIVPIAVGLILAGLVVVVLVAYLIGRKRAQARGYLSM